MKGKVAVVTGGASGIGRAAVDAFAERGVSIVIGDVDTRLGEEAAAAVCAAGGSAEFIATDVSDDAQVRAMVDLAVERYGGLDYAFNNAGAIAVVKPVHEITDEDVSRVMGVNFVGTLLCLRHEIPRMLERGGGAIVNTSSNAAVHGNPGWGIYASSKAANLHLTRVAAAECGPQGIRVNAVLPGPIDTPLFRVEADRTEGWTDVVTSRTVLRRMGQPREVGAAVVWLCSDEAGFVTGIAMPVDGGSGLR